MTIDGWVPLDDFCAKYGERKTTIHKRVSEGLWPRGEIYSAPDGTNAYIHEARAVAWLRERKKLHIIG